MSNVITGDGSDVISRKIDESQPLNIVLENVADIFCVAETSEWVRCNNFEKIGLQFPDELLFASVPICRDLSKMTNKFCFILGDSSFAGCCVDEVAGKRFNMDALVHYGRACLSRFSGCLLVLYVFGQLPSPISHMPDWLTSVTNQLISRLSVDSQKPTAVLLTYDFCYQQVASHLFESLLAQCTHIPIYWSEPDLDTTSCASVSPFSDRVGPVIFKRGGRQFHLVSHAGDPRAKEANVPPPSPPWAMIHLARFKDRAGESDADRLSFYRVALALPEVSQAHAYCVSVESPVVDIAAKALHNLLKRRSYLIEKAKDAQRVGILIGTVSVRDFRALCDRLKQLLHRAGRFHVQLVVGRLNAAKLANLPELDLLVLVACPEASLLDSRDMIIPVVTPFELECALGDYVYKDELTDNLDTQRRWTGEKCWTDFRDLLPGGAAHIPITDVVPESTETSGVHTNVSLITGHIRQMHLPTSSIEVSTSEDSALVPRGDWSLLETHGGPSEKGRTWYGLDPKLGQHAPAKLRDGRMGVPTGYIALSTPDSNDAVE